MNINTLSTPVTNLKGSAEQTAAKQDAELRETCAAFEGMFFQMMMKTMREASMESSLVKKSNGEKVFTEMLDQEYVTLAAKTGNAGLGETLYNHIKQTVPGYGQVGNNFPHENTPTPYDMKNILEKSKNQGSTVDFIK